MKMTMDCITVPIEEDGKEISAKAYLGRQDIRELQVPMQVTKIGNWAFSHMKNLKVIWLPAHRIEFGRDVFDECKQLEEVRLYGEDMSVVNANATHLLADAVVYMKGESLCTPDAGTAEWMERYDTLLVNYLHAEEDADFNLMWFGGEEDYDDTDTNVAKYKKEKRMIKAELIYDRLLESDHLADNIRETLYESLRHMIPESDASLSKGNIDICNESLEIICQRHSHDVRYIKIFTEAGCMNERNVEYILEHAKSFGTELKAWLLSYREKQLAKRDVDAEFAL